MTVKCIEIINKELLYYANATNVEKEIGNKKIFSRLPREYPSEDNDPLFCTEYGLPLTENALRKSIVRYNTRRGVNKTSIHLFRHTFARKYLIDCGGDAFTLQKLLGHSTLQMTKHYCAIFDADIAKNFDNFSPLAQMKQGGERITLRR